MPESPELPDGKTTNGASPRQRAQSCQTGRPLAEFLDSGEVEEGELLAAIVDGEDAG